MTILACTLITISLEPFSSDGQALTVLSSPAVTIVLVLVCIMMFLCALAGRDATEMYYSPACSATGKAGLDTCTSA